MSRSNVVRTHASMEGYNSRKSDLLVNVSNFLPSPCLHEKLQVYLRAATENPLSKHRLLLLYYIYVYIFVLQINLNLRSTCKLLPVLDHIKGYSNR